MTKRSEEKRIVTIFSLASFLNDMGSDMIYPVWPVFVTMVLGANTTILGLVDGIGDALHSISKAISGYLSDRVGKRKPFIWLGYLMGSLSRLGYAFSTVWWHLVPFKVLDRMGKIRGAPRDAMVAEVSTKKTRGKNFGLLRMMDNLGAVTGIVLSMLLLDILGYRNLFILASIPSLISTILIISLIKDKPTTTREKFKLRFLGKRYKRFLFASIIFSSGYFSYSFLLLYAKSLGFKENLLPIFYLIFTLTASIFSLPFGKISDKVGRKSSIVISYLLWIFTLVLALMFKNFITPFIVFFLYGLQKAMMEPSQRAFVSELSPKKFKATGIGTFQMLVGLSAFPASLIVGYTWDMYGMDIALQFPILMTVISLVILLTV